MIHTKLCNKHGYYEEGRGCNACMQEFKQEAQPATASPAMRELATLIDYAKLRARLEKVRDELVDGCRRYSAERREAPAVIAAARALRMLEDILEGKQE